MAPAISYRPVYGGGNLLRYYTKMYVTAAHPVSVVRVGVVVFLLALLTNCATTANRGAPSIPASLEAFANTPVERLPELFEMGQAPRPHTLLGTHAGRILYPGSTTAPPWVVSLTRIAGAAWQGKRFVENRDGEVVGVNLLFGTTYGLQSMPMRLVLGSAVHSDQPVLKLYYDLEYNPEAVHAVFDELVRLPNGFLLGRAYWRRAQGPPVFWMWFVLAPARSGGVDGHE